MSRRFILLLIGLILLVGVGYWGWSILQREVVEPVQDIIEEIPDDVQVDISAQGIELSQGEDGRLDWSVKANSVRYDQEGGIATLVEPRIAYYPESGKDPIHAEAPEGQVDRTNNVFRLGPDVKVTTRDAVLTADQLEYEGKDRQIVLIGNVRIMRDNATLKANKVRLDVDTGKARADGGVTFSFTTAPLETEALPSLNLPESSEGEKE